ncbi:phosphopantetheine-binding protein, partial [Streptomyces populi]|uniref:phosphopantetheine-binding protein n=1 Tax=Streptomyces populi TaxID=2058924 RepID=UPI0035E2CEB6
EGCKTRRLRVSHAFHSPLMEPMLEDFARVVEGLSFAVPRIPIVSTVSGRAGEDFTDPGYWVRQVRCPVRFADAVAALAGEGVTDTLEVGPDAVLTPAAGQSAGEEVRTVALQRRDRGESAALLAGLGELWTNGTHVDWNTLTTHRTGDRTTTTTGAVGLPTYAFQHQRYWLDEVAATSVVGETAEAFWAAARGGDVTAAAAALGLPAGASLADIVTVLAAGPAAAPSFGTAGTSGAPQDTVDPAVLLKERLANAPDGERHGIVLAVVRSEAAAVLALPGAEDLDTRAELLDLGFSSLMAVELRNQLGAITGVQVPPTLVYDYPSAHDVATFLCDALAA